MSATKAKNELEVSSEATASELKVCSLCKRELPLSSFFKDKSVKSGYKSQCKECIKKKRSELPKSVSRGYNLKYRYGMTEDQYTAMLEAQGGRCAICKRKPGRSKLHVDHDHSCCPGQKSCGKCVRGLLCSGCNYKLLGTICQETKKGKEYAKDILRQAIDYLDRR